jgi:hypothetical protein
MSDQDTPASHKRNGPNGTDGKWVAELVMTAIPKNALGNGEAEAIGGSWGVHVPACTHPVFKPSLPDA